MIALLCLLVWLYLFFAHGSFWRSGPQLLPATTPDHRAELPAVDIIVPARDEAPTIGAAIQSLLAQDYTGPFRVVLVDDNSSDDTAARAGNAPILQVLRLTEKPPGWSGKLWALSQGVAAGNAPLMLFTDADIVHDPRHLSSLVATLRSASVNVVSEMVKLNCVSLAERALVPAFVYFFQMLYPFARVNDPSSAVAAAAGGTVLIRRSTLEQLGGIESIREALIDDVSLARAAKRFGGIYLGHSVLAESVRPYPYFADIWRMISRTAFTQLRYSAPLLLLTLVGLALVWWAPALESLFGAGWRAACGQAAYGLAVISYQPTLRRYRRSPAWALGLPLIALFYMAATVASALDHWRGKGASWKNRAYP
jgi:hopene-associated glycosyltransferase HpnB